MDKMLLSGHKFYWLVHNMSTIKSTVLSTERGAL